MWIISFLWIFTTKMKHFVSKSWRVYDQRQITQTFWRHLFKYKNKIYHFWRKWLSLIRIWFYYCQYHFYWIQTERLICGQADWPSFHGYYNNHGLKIYLVKVSISLLYTKQTLCTGRCDINAVFETFSTWLRSKSMFDAIMVIGNMYK